MLVWATAKHWYRCVSYMEHPFDVPRLEQHPVYASRHPAGSLEVVFSFICF